VTDEQTAASLARGIWTLVEPIHAVGYFAPEGRAGFEAAGLRGFWRGYFAARAAPLGPVAAAPVTALFCSFSPAITTRALPAVWDLIDPATALVVRAETAAASLRRLSAGLVDRDGVADLADQLWTALVGLDVTGRALGAANAVLPRPDDPYQALWQAATTIREHRGDGHVAAVVAADLSGLEILVLRSAADLSRAVLQSARGWTDDEWDRADEGLRVRGLLAGSPQSVAVTDAGRRLLAEIEAITDRIATRPWGSLLSTGGLHTLAIALKPVAEACQSGFPQPNPIGLLTIWDAIAAPTGTGWSSARAQVG
jgi:hypothetical protein